MALQKKGLRIAGFLNYEREGIKFFTRCLQRTNQFSTKYILQKVLLFQKEYLAAIEQDLRHLDSALPGEFISLEDTFANSETLYDLDTLNFLEATKMAIRIAERQWAVYKKYRSRESDTALQEIFSRLIEQKKRYINTIKKKFDNLH
jgi:hypothetical protein